MATAAQTGNVASTSAENVSVERILHSVETLSRQKEKEVGISPGKNGAMSFKEILDLGVSPCELSSWVATWPTLGGQVSVRESVARKLSDLEIC